MTTRDQQLYVGAYWRSRPETPSSAAERLARMVEELSAPDPGVGDWVVARDEPLPTGPALVEWLIPLFDPAVTGRQPAIGASFFLLSGAGTGDQVLELRVTCGLHDAAPVLTNAVVVSPSTRGADAGPLAGRAEQVLGAFVRAWEPEWAVATTGALQQLAAGRAARQRGPIPGVLTWLSDAFPDAAPAPDGVRVTPLAGGRLVDAGALTDDAERFGDFVAGWAEAGALTVPAHS